MHGGMVQMCEAGMDADAYAALTPRAAYEDVWGAGRQAAQGKWRRLQVDDAALATLAGMGFKSALVCASAE